MITLRSNIFIWLPVLTCLIASCASKREVTFISMEPGSKMALVPVGSPDAEGKKLRNPAKLDTAKLTKQAVRVSSVGKASQYWFLPGNKGQRIQVRIKNLPACEGAEGNRNRPMRLLLKSYQALYSKEFQLARELARKASVIDATLAAPHLIVGLTYLREGNRTRAKASFNKARALDPEDAEIGVLLRTVQ